MRKSRFCAEYLTNDPGAQVLIRQVLSEGRPVSALVSLAAPTAVRHPGRPPWHMGRRQGPLDPTSAGPYTLDAAHVLWYARRRGILGNHILPGPRLSS